MTASSEPPVRVARASLSRRRAREWEVRATRRLGKVFATARRKIRARRAMPVSNHADIVTLGRGSYFAPELIYHEGDTARIRIGNYCSIAANVEFIPGGNHRVDWVSTYPFRIQFDLAGRGNDGHPASKGDIVVGNDVWIGRGACILSGVTIGNGAVVAAHSVVAKDVPAYAIAAGSPARIMKYRFDREIVEMLERIAWWEWPESTIRERVDDLSNSNLEEFVRRYGSSELA